jgi:hypothetical protein
MDQSPWESYSCTTDQEIICVLYNPKIQYIDKRNFIIQHMKYNLDITII